MKTAALLVAASVLFTSSALAQSAPSASVPPPPGINDPGVQATQPATKPATRHRSTRVAPSGQPLNLKPQALPAMQGEGNVRSGRDQAPPEVRIRQQGDNSIQEYSRNGRVYMVVITPKSGITQTYMVDPQGRLVDEHGQKPVGPVMYKVLEWGKSPPPAESASEAPPADDGH